MPVYATTRGTGASTSCGTGISSPTTPASSATPALIRNASSKPRSAGARRRSRGRRRSTAATCAAERRADVAGDRVDAGRLAGLVRRRRRRRSRFGSAANAQPTPVLSITPQRMISAAESWAKRHAEQPAGGQERSRRRAASLEPMRSLTRPTIGATKQHHQPAGRHQQAGLGGARGRARRRRPSAARRSAGSARTCRTGRSRRAASRGRSISTGGRASVRMLISGAAVAALEDHEADQDDAGRPRSRPSVLSDAQPQSLAREIAISTADRPTARITAPTTSTRPGVRTGDSGTKRIVVIVGDDAHRRREPEDPVVARPGRRAGRRAAGRSRRRCRRSRRAARCRSGSCSRGNSSRTIPNESGNTPPPTPCSTRPTIIRPRPLLSAQTTEPTANAPSEIARKRSLPNMSPRRPRTGVATEAARKYALTIHVMPLVPTPKASLHRGQRRDHGRLGEREGERADRRGWRG